MNIELYNDDCMNVLDTIDKKIDLAIFDLPYGQTACEWDNKILVWNKASTAGFLSSGKMPLRAHEMIYIFYKKLPTYNVKEYHKKVIEHTKEPITENNKPITENVYGVKTRPRGYTYNNPLPKSILDFNMNRNMKTRNHPTEKPVELLKWLIRYYSNEGDVVLDITMGSGSTGVAAKSCRKRVKQIFYWNRVRQEIL